MKREKKERKKERKERKKKTLWPLVRKRTAPTERLPLVGEVGANFCG
jgi:hypothetical protein